MAQLIDLKVGFSCNNKCIHCVVSDKYSEKDLLLAEIESLIENYIAQYGRISLTLTGGEITIRKDYCQLMHFLKNKKDQGDIEFIDIQTNGRLLSKDKVLECTIPVVDFYLIALHGNTAEIHDSITLSKGSFAETTQGLHKLIQKVNNNTIAIQTVINRNNYKILKNIYRFAYDEFGIQEYNITFPHPLGVAFNTNVTPTYLEVRDYVNDALRYCLELGINPYLEALPFCVFVDELRGYALQFYRKKQFQSGVIGFGGEKDGHIDYSIVQNEGYSKYESCINCDFNNICLGVWKEYKELYPTYDMYSLMTKRQN